MKVQVRRDNPTLTNQSDTVTFQTRTLPTGGTRVYVTTLNPQRTELGKATHDFPGGIVDAMRWIDAREQRLTTAYGFARRTR
ncbi:hypothetical protein [Microbispora sp. NPDC049125]|uniref:hypothetical protein n=1 Tax=Microbispora sp. NPDC049125 TaxID=3154929 RepID=UPI003465FF6F